MSDLSELKVRQRNQLAVGGSHKVINHVRSKSVLSGYNGGSAYTGGDYGQRINQRSSASLLYNSSIDSRASRDRSQPRRREYR